MKPVNYFYSHLVDLEPLEKELSLLDLKPAQKKELLEIAHINLHATILDAILSELTQADKKKFLTLVALGQEEKIWSHLNDKVENVEGKITKAAFDLKSELKKDIERLKS